MTLRDEITAKALTLSADDRIYVADQIEQSLISGGFATQEITQSWVDEINRRLAEYQRGEVQALDFDQVIEQIRTRLKERQNPSTGP